MNEVARPVLAREYRVTWKREGLRVKHSVCVYLATAERHVQRLIDSDKDPYWKSEEGWPTDPMPPLIARPTIEVRDVSAWRAVDGLQG